MIVGGMREICVCVFFFFFSSRRRHTRFDCDWSSEVCSSDLCWKAIRGCNWAVKGRGPNVVFELPRCADLQKQSCRPIGVKAEPFATLNGRPDRKSVV